MDEPLIKFKTPFQNQFEKTQKQLQELKENNNVLTQYYHQMQQKEVQDQRNKFRIKVEQVKDQIQQVEGMARGVEQKQKVKELKTGLAKEVDRQKILLRSFVKQSFESRFNRISMLKQSKANKDTNDQGQYFIEPANLQIKQKDAGSQDILSINDGSMLSEQDIIDYERQLVQERQEELDEIEQEAIILNQIVGEMGTIANEQDSQFDQIQDNQHQTKNNLKDTNKELKGAREIQVRRNKVLITAAIIIVIIVIVIAILIITQVI